ncbi:DMT family transporter [Cohnella yongneupensis]|uniref:DMT family transporter n=1 Tax=Cohnella yongneupensis TaxID=425006 RepID=A0ABW0QVE1_9BACL
MTVLLFLWGSFAAASKIALESLDNYQIQFYMFGSATLINTAIIAYTGRMKAVLSLSLKDISKLLLIGLPYYFYFLLYILSLNKIPVVEASMLNYLFPLFIVLLSAFMFGERLTPSKTASILLGLVGMIIIVTDGNMSAIRLTDLGGDLLAISGALCWALFSVFGKKSRTDQDLGIYLFTITSFVLSSFGLFFFSNLTAPDMKGIGTTIWLAVSNIVLGNILWFRGLRSPSSTLIANLSYLTPFVTLLFIVILLGEQLKTAQIGGFIVILSGIALQVATDKIRKPGIRTESRSKAGSKEQSSSLK